jgi:hypothetical protein
MVAKDIAARWEWPLRRFAWLEVAWVWVPESRSWGLSCEFVGAAMRPR